MLHWNRHVLNAIIYASVSDIFIYMLTMDTIRAPVDILDTAGKMLEKYLAMDSYFPTLIDVTQITPQGMISSLTRKCVGDIVGNENWLTTDCRCSVNHNTSRTQ
jgi:hypothetical protein